MAQLPRNLNPQPPILDHNLYRYQMRDGPSNLGKVEEEINQGAQPTSPLGAIMGLRHMLPSTSPTGEPAAPTQAQSIGPTADELAAQGFRVGDFKANSVYRGEPTPEQMPPGFDNGRWGPQVGEPGWEYRDEFAPPAGEAASGFGEGEEAMGAAPEQGGGFSLPERLKPILSGLGAGIAANNMAVGVGVMNNRRDIAYRRAEYEDQKQRELAKERQGMEDMKRKNSATLSFLEKQVGAGKLDPAVLDVARANPELAGELMRESLKRPDQPTPYTDAGKATMDYKSGLISEEMHKNLMAAASQQATPGFEKVGVARREYLNDPKVKKYDVIDTQYRNVRDGINTLVAEGNSGPAALNIMYGYMKMLSPESTVMKGELELAEGLGSIPQKVWALYEKAVNGETIPAEVLKQYAKQADNIYNGARVDLERANSYYDNVRSEYGVSEREWPFYQPKAYEPIDFGTFTGTPGTVAPAGGGSRMITPDIEEMP